MFEIYRVHYFRKPTQHPPKKPKVGNMWEIPLFPNPLRKAKCCHFCSTMPVCAQAGWCALGVKCAARCSLLTSQTAPHSHADATTRSDMLVRAQMNLNTEMLAACSAAAASRACTERDRR